MRLRNPFADNPLVLRAFRVGFRPGGFRLGLLVFLLVVALAIPIIIDVAVDRDIDGPELSGTLLWILLIFTGGTFLVGGLQRTLSAFSRERERGTFDFLHLSTMTPATVVLGFLLAGQLPGYLFLVFTLPVMVILAFVAKLKITMVLLLVLVMVFYAAWMSLFYLLVGFWMRKVSDLRGGALLLTVLGMMLGAGGIAFTLQIPQVQAGEWGPVPFLYIFTVFPVLSNLWQRASEGGVPSMLPEYTPFFGQDMALELHAVGFLLPLGVLMFFTLARSFRHRERRPLSNVGALFLVLWAQFWLTGLFWGSSMEAGRKVFLVACASWLISVFLVLQRSDRPRAAMARLLFEVGGDRKRMFFHRDAPPYAIVLGLALATTAFGFLQQWGTEQAISAVAILAVPVALPVHALLYQYFSWRGLSKGLWIWLYHGLIVFGPLVGYFTAVALVMAEVPFPDLRPLFLISPLTATLVLAEAGPAPVEPLERVAGFIGLGLHVVLGSLLLLVHSRQVRRIASYAGPETGSEATA